jgi:hypothetical protein
VVEPANVVESFVAALLVRRLRAESFASVGSVLLFVVLACVLAPAVGGLLGAWGTKVQSPGFDYLTVYGRWVIGDGLGILTVVPAGVLLLRGGQRRLLRTPEAALCLLTVAGVSVVIFGAGFNVARPNLAVPALLWAAIRLRVAGAAVAMFLTAQIGNLATGLGYGPFAAAEAAGNGGVLQLQMYLATMAVTMLVIGARTHESAGHQLAATAEQHRAELEDALTRLGQAALDSVDGEELQHQAASILEPIIGRETTEQLLRSPPDLLATEGANPELGPGVDLDLDLRASRTRHGRCCTPPAGASTPSRSSWPPSRSWRSRRSSSGCCSPRPGRGCTASTSPVVARS